EGVKQGRHRGRSDPLPCTGLAGTPVGGFLTAHPGLEPAPPLRAGGGVLLVRAGGPGRGAVGVKRPDAVPDGGRDVAVEQPHRMSSMGRFLVKMGAPGWRVPFKKWSRAYQAASEKYSWSTPPKRSRRSTRPVSEAAVGSRC